MQVALKFDKEGWEDGDSALQVRGRIEEASPHREGAEGSIKAWVVAQPIDLHKKVNVVASGVE